jgi:hypothetical protein
MVGDSAPTAGGQALRNRVGVAVFVFLSSVLFATNGFSTHGQYYVLDGFGGVHAGNGAPAISPATPYFGFNVARDIAYIPVGSSTGSAGDGILVLDGFGGVHAGGALVGEGVVSGTPYFGFDIAQAIVYRNIPPRISGVATATINTEVTSATYVSILSTTLRAPDNGFVFVDCNMSMGNNGSAISLARIGIGVDSLANTDSFSGHAIHMEPVPADSFRSESVSRTVPVSAGLHTFHCLVFKASGGVNGQVLYYDPSITAIYIDQGGTGISAPEAAPVAGPTGPVR